MEEEPVPVVRRFHELLVAEIRTRRPEYLRAPFTVAEIYQNLVPYATHRDRLGVQMNGDYEDALLRLLAGEGGYLVLDSEPALREMREELATTNPNTGIYREYAAVDVRLNPAATDSVPAAAGEAARWDLLRGLGRGEAAEAPAAPETRAPARGAQAAVPRAQPGGRTDDSDARASCRWCKAELPARANLRFCPFCGGDVNVVPCPHCGEELEAGWRFCVACGTAVEP